MRQIANLSLACAVAALAVSPAQAVELPRVAPATKAEYSTTTVLENGADTAEYRRHYRYRRHHRDRVDAGDVIAGALIIGGIFAVLSASNNNRNDRYDRDDFEDNAFDSAIDSCVDRVDREQRVGTVDNVGRTRNGYSVSGTLASGSPFSCEVSGAGRVIGVNYGYGSVSYQAGGDTYGDPQFSDDAYARARANTYSTPSTYSTPDTSAQPAYPGGPIDGDQQYSDDYYGDTSYGDEGEPY